jgi:hypothetical protein
MEVLTIQDSESETQKPEFKMRGKCVLHNIVHKVPSLFFVVY